MVKATAIKTETYWMEGTYMVDIVTNTNNQMRDAYLYHRDYAIKMHMFGFVDQTGKEFKRCVQDRFEEYRDIYQAEYEN